MVNPNHSNRDEKASGWLYSNWGNDTEGFGDSRESAEELAARDREVFGDSGGFADEYDMDTGTSYRRARPHAD